MRLQVISLGLALIPVSFALAGPETASSCFDFSKKMTQPKKKPSALPDVAVPKISKISGKLKTGPTWGAVRARVERPIQELVKEIADHQALRSKKIDEMIVTPLDSSEAMIRQQVHYIVKPFLFVKVDWTEDWAFNLDQGTKDSPGQVTVFYEKTDGTNHIKHLCGNFILNKVDPKTTDVFIYEEADATGRSVEDTVNGLAGTIKTFRAPPPS